MKVLVYGELFTWVKQALAKQRRYLRARITEEFKDERAFIWCGNHTGLEDIAVKNIWRKFYPPNSNAAENHINRALKKKKPRI